MGPHPAVAAVRLAIRHCLGDVEPGSTLLVACSGGADSLALLAGTLFESRSGAHQVVAVTVDHALQPGSTQRAESIVRQMRRLGSGAESVGVTVGTEGGPEAAARTARYDALTRAASRHDAATVLLGHTRDDQAETVLLGLARGSGARSLSGMAPVNGIYRRPLLGLSRRDTVAACRAEGIEVWEDPHNTDPSFARVRVRRAVLPVLETHLGPGVGDALARTARLLRDDADALDDLAARAARDARDEAGELRVESLCAQPPAVRRRVIRLAAVEAGCPATELFLSHVDAVDALLTDWHGQQGIDLPGPVRARRAQGTLRFVPGAVAG